MAKLITNLIKDLNRFENLLSLAPAMIPKLSVEQRERLKAELTLLEKKLKASQEVLKC